MASSSRRAILRRFALSLSVGLMVFTASASAGVKEDLHAEMALLQAQADALKASGQGNTEAYADATSRCAEISAQLGGDRPGATGSASSAPTPSGSAGIVPTPPPNCVPTTASFANNTPLAIPTGPAVVSNTIVVSGAGTFIWDVNAITNLQHTFAADLDVTIQSPAGTVVTLTTDNGAGNDDVFNGTVWDDDANPAGQVPYTSNNGLVTDHLYANLVTATPLVPEESLAAFYGENPNGTWTITISDDLAGDGGTLNSWSLGITTFPAAPLAATTSVTNSTPVAIPTGPAVVTSTVALAGAGTSVCGLTLTSAITHTFSADLDITLLSPAGTVVTLTTDNGAGNDNVFNGTLWSDTANPAGQVPYTTNNGLVTDQLYANLVTATPLVAEESFGAFFGENPNGTWTMTVSDDLAGDGGSLDSWTLNVTTCTCALPNADVAVTLTAAAPTPLVVNSQITYTITATNNGPATATSTVATLNLAANTAYVSNTCGAANAGNTVTWSIGTLANAASQTCNVVARVTSAGAVIANASIVSAQTDPVTTNNTASSTLQGVVASIPINASWALLAMFAGLIAMGVLVLRRRRAHG